MSLDVSLDAAPDVVPPSMQASLLATLKPLMPPGLLPPTPPTAQPQPPPSRLERMAVAALDIARKCVRGRVSLAPPPIAGSTPIGSMMQACAARQLELAERVAKGENIRLLCHCRGKRCHLEATASRIRKLLASPLAHPRVPSATPLMWKRSNM